MPTQTLIESTSRIVHQSHTGMEIIREFNVEPYAHHIAVLKHLQGFIKDGERVPPAQDPWIDVCYCTEARAEQWHEDQLVTSESLDVISRETKDGKQKVERLPAFDADRIKNLLQMNRENPKVGTAGAKVTAIYRPLISAVTDNESPKRWDWLDPKIVPGQSTVPWPGGLIVKAEGLADIQLVKIPDDAATPIPMTISDVSIRRILVAEPHWTEMAAMFNKLNKDTFPPQDHEAAGGLPEFERATLKYVGPTIEYNLDSEGGRWYTITQHFQWLQIFDPVIVDVHAQKAPGWVTWNHQLMHPRVGSPIGWYPVQKEGTALANIQFIGINYSVGFIHDLADFMPLFGE